MFFFRIINVDRSLVRLGQMIPMDRIDGLKYVDNYLQDVIVSLLFMYCQRALKENCEGCAIDSPSQKDHDCMMASSEDIRNRYFDAGYSRLSDKLVAAVYGYNGKETQGILENFTDYKVRKQSFFYGELMAVLSNGSPSHSEFREIMKLFL